MANIDPSLFKDWNDGDIVRAKDYKQEREILRVAINHNHNELLEEASKSQGIAARVSDLENDVSNQQSELDQVSNDFSNHVQSNDHDTRYYTKGQTDTRIVVMTSSHEFIDGGTFLDFYPSSVGSFDGGEW